MAREMPKDRAARRAAVEEKMSKSPIQRMVDAITTGAAIGAAYMPRDSARDKQAKEFGKRAAKQFSTGKHTAEETGAANLARRRNVMEAAMYQSDKKVIKKGVAKKGY